MTKSLSPDGGYCLTGLVKKFFIKLTNIKTVIPCLTRDLASVIFIKMKEYYVYIITNYEKTTLYTGISSDLVKRIYEHKNKLIEGFSKKYHLQYLVYYEIHNDVNVAISREKLIKKWKRQWKIDLIKKVNPEFLDLYNQGNIMPLDPIE